MSAKNPTVALHVTRKELAVIERALGWNAPIGSLRDRLNEAHDAMRLANRDKNRANKAARIARKAHFNFMEGEECPNSTSPSE
jgi:hypothetical protein